LPIKKPARREAAGFFDRAGRVPGTGSNAGGHDYFDFLRS
jgi:hypothetical protein